MLTKKRLLLASLCIFSFVLTHAQNKSLGVGTTTPNSNAALHVESPTANQGFIMPRLTTAQRTAMSALLTANDSGLMLYDTDLSTIYVWSGSAWKTTADVAGGAKLAMPYRDSVATPTGTNDLFKLQYNNAEQKRVLRIEQLNASNPASTISARQEGSGIGLYVQVANATNGGTAIYGTTNSNLGGPLSPVGVYGESTGTGSNAAAFRINNTGNTFPAVYAETNGTAPVLFLNNINASNTAPNIHINNSAPNFTALYTTGKISAGSLQGDGSLITNLPPVSFPFAATGLNTTTTAFELANSGTGKVASFTSTSLTSTEAALRVYGDGNGSVGTGGIYAETVAGFAAVTGKATGAGGANGVFAFSDAPNDFSFALYAQNNSQGRAGAFRINYANSAVPAVEIESNGVHSNGIHVKQTHATNDSSGVYVETAAATASIRGWNRNSSFGSGVHGVADGGNGFGVFGEARTSSFGIGVLGYNNTTSGGFAGSFEVTSASSPAIGLKAMTIGTGQAAQVFINNSSSSATALDVNTDGTGSAIFAQTTNATNGAPALAAVSQGTGAAVSAFTSTSFSALHATAQGANRNAAIIELTGGAGTYPALQVNTDGTGSAGNFSNTNPLNTAPAIFAQTNSPGAAISADNTADGDAIAGIKSGSIGSGGNFQTNNASNPASALYVQSNSTAGGASAALNQTGNGTALWLMAGGLKISVANVTSTTISTRAAAYNITSGGTAFGFPGGFASEGDIFYVYNGTGQAITFESNALAIGEAKTFVVIGGAVRAF